MQPLAEYSSYIMEESAISPGADPKTQEFISVFFSLRDENEGRYKAEATKLLKQHVLITTKNGITFNYQIKNKIVSCATSPILTNAFDGPVTHLKLEWRKSINKIILVDLFADYEARAILHYSTDH